MSITVRKPQPRDGGFTMVEALVVMTIVSILAFIALPRIFGGREKALTAACSANYHRLDGDLVNHMATFTSEGEPAVASQAIATVVAQAELDAVPNPRRKSEPAFVNGAAGPIIPGPGTSCQVFFYDGTASQALQAPTVIVTQSEYGVRSFRVSLD